MLRHNTIKIGGLLYVLAVFQFFVFELVAETLYPGYSVATNYVSDLGATCVNPPSNLDYVVHQPTAGIFDATVSLMGLALLVGALFVYRGTRKKPYLIVSAVADPAILLIGVFPEDTAGHTQWCRSSPLSSLDPLVLAWTIVKEKIISYLLAAFGALTLFFTLTDVPARDVGVGGQERLLVLSALVGLLTLGGYLGSPGTSPNGASRA